MPARSLLLCAYILQAAIYISPVRFNFSALPTARHGANLELHPRSRGPRHLPSFLLLRLVQVVSVTKQTSHTLSRQCNLCYLLDSGMSKSVKWTHALSSSPTWTTWSAVTPARSHTRLNISNDGFSTPSSSLNSTGLRSGRTSKSANTDPGGEFSSHVR